MNPEKEKYTKLWSTLEYRMASPGMDNVNNFIQHMPPAYTQAGTVRSVIDFGCGPGRATLMLQKCGYEVYGVDFAENCLDAQVRGNIEFHVADLTELVDKDLPCGKADLGFCCDVMEHIPPRDVVRVIDGIMENVKDRCYFQIACRDDYFGKLVGEKLHLTVNPPSWWLATLSGMGYQIEWSDATPGELKCIISHK